MKSEKGWFDPRKALHEVLGGVINEETADNLINVLEESGAAVLMPTTTDEIPLSKDSKREGSSMCAWTPDGFSFSSQYNIITFNGSRALPPGTKMYLHAIGRGKALQDAVNEPKGRTANE